MKAFIQRLIACGGLLLVAPSAFAEDSKASVEPQPRMRIDPTSLYSPVPTKITTPAPTSSTTTVMPRYVVREQSLTPYLLRRPGVEDPKGKFKLKEGGRFVGTTAGPFSVEVGIWGHIDIMDPDAPAKCLDFLRIKW